MLMGNLLSTAVKPIRVMNAQAAGLTTVNGSWVDLQNADGARFLVAFGALTATQVTYVKLQGATTSNQSDAADLLDVDTGTVIRTANLADTDSNKIVSLEVYKCKVRYVRPVVVRGTANAVVDGAIAEVVVRNKLPMVKDTTQAVATVTSGYAKI